MLSISILLLSGKNRGDFPFDTLVEDMLDCSKRERTTGKAARERVGELLGELKHSINSNKGSTA